MTYIRRLKISTWQLCHKPDVIKGKYVDCLAERGKVQNYKRSCMLEGSYNPTSAHMSLS